MQPLYHQRTFYQPKLLSWLFLELFEQVQVFSFSPNSLRYFVPPYITLPVPVVTQEDTGLKIRCSAFLGSNTLLMVEASITRHIVLYTK